MTPPTMDTHNKANEQLQICYCIIIITWISNIAYYDAIFFDGLISFDGTSLGIIGLVSAVPS